MRNNSQTLQDGCWFTGSCDCQPFMECRDLTANIWHAARHGLLTPENRPYGLHSMNIFFSEANCYDRFRSSNLSSHQKRAVNWLQQG